MRSTWELISRRRLSLLQLNSASDRCSQHCTKAHSLVTRNLEISFLVLFGVASRFPSTSVPIQNNTSTVATCAYLRPASPALVHCLPNSLASSRKVLNCVALLRSTNGEGEACAFNQYRRSSFTLRVMRKSARGMFLSNTTGSFPYG